LSHVDGRGCISTPKWPGNGNIRIDGGDISKAAKPVIFSGGATSKAVKVEQRNGEMRD
jgi:hypothetical protein